MKGFLILRYYLGFFLSAGFPFFFFISRLQIDCLGFVLSAIPLPESLVDWRPCWLAMFLIYWCMALPERVGVSSAWILGLLFDVQQSFIFGQHALGFTFLAYIILKNHKQLRMYPLLHQAIMVCVYLIMYKAIMLLVTFLVV